MIESPKINEIFGVSESYQLPDKLMEVLSIKETREAIFSELLLLESDLSYDWFTDYFQEQHSNRQSMMQDFTPRSVTRLVAEMKSEYSTIADICAGTGGLTIAAWNKHPAACFYCEELSQRAFPLLMLNLAIRNMNAIAVNKDVLTGEIYAVYRFTTSEKFSNIEQLDSVPKLDDFDFVIMNPPYSVKHKWNEKQADERFDGYGYPPNNFADFAFVLHGLNIMKDGGTLAAVLPHGVLFRGGREETIRTKLIENNLLYAVIGLPEKLFLNTGIPVCIFVLRKSENILIIDSSKLCAKKAKLNFMENKHIEKVISLYKIRENVEKLSHIAEFDELKENDFNLNIPRYVDTYEPPEVPCLTDVSREIAICQAEIRDLDMEILKSMKELVAGNPQLSADLKEGIRIWEGMCNGDPVQLGF